MLKNTIQETYKDDPKLKRYLSFQVVYEKKTLKSAGAQYLSSTRTIRMLLNGDNFEDMLLDTLIHEATHHIQYMRDGYTDHSKDFRSIQKELLFTAMDLNYIEPFRLRARYIYLSNYREQTKVVKMLDEYIRMNRLKKTEHFIGYIFPYDASKVTLLKAQGFRFSKAGNYRNKTSNIWYKFSSNDDDYNIFKDERDVIVVFD